MQIFYKVLLYIFQYVKLTMDFLRGHQYWEYFYGQYYEETS